jgi:hypothetical protein
LDPVSRVAAGPHAAPLLTDAPRADGLGARAIRQRRPVLSYEEPDLEIHPTQRAAGAEIEGQRVGRGFVVTEARGQPRDVVAQASKVGWLFVHDRESGELLRRSAAFVPQENLFARPTAEGVRIAPSALGGCSWSPISIDLAQGRAFVAAVHWPAMYYSRKLDQPGLPWDTYTFVKPIPGAGEGVLAAIDLRSGDIAWRAPMDQPLIGGVLATAGKVVFVGESGGRFTAVDSEAGTKLWSDAIASGVNAPPVTYAVGGRQFVAVAAGGNSLFGFKPGDELIAYALPAAGKAP